MEIPSAFIKHHVTLRLQLGRVKDMIDMGLGAAVAITVRLVYTSIMYVSSILRMVAVTLPSNIYAQLPASLTVTLNATTLLLLFVILVSSVSWLARYRFLNVYARLPVEPPLKAPQIDLVTEPPTGDSKPGLHNYLEEFLSAIKIFGYLERPVFHELTRSMQTRKLIAGETLILEEEKGFCLVVDGNVQIFVQSNLAADSETDHVSMTQSAQATQINVDEPGKDHSAHNHYELLTEVTNGSPMSSLISILSLFTDNVKLRRSPDSRPASAYARPDGQWTNSTSTREMVLGNTIDNYHISRGHARGLSADVVIDQSTNIPPLSLDHSWSDGRGLGYHQDRSRRESNRKDSTIRPDIIARATKDTTIAVIPATAFHRLTRMYPKASAHIVQVILTRLQRVTFGTAHSYLGLTAEVLKMENSMSCFTDFDLPNDLRGAALDHMKEKFISQKSRLSQDQWNHGIALAKRADDHVPKQDSANSRLWKSAFGNNHSLSANHTPRWKDEVSAGDLLTNIQISRIGKRPHISTSFDSQPIRSPQIQPTVDQLASPLSRKDRGAYFSSSPVEIDAEDRDGTITHADTVLVRKTLECLFKTIGLIDSRDEIRRPVESVDQSPQILSYDVYKRRATFANAFGQIDPFEGSNDSESESGASQMMNDQIIYASRALIDEMQDHLEIVHFPKDAMLVEQGERNPGLYYVIDGFLDVGVPEVNVFNANIVQDSGVSRNKPEGVNSDMRQPFVSTREHQTHQTTAQDRTFCIKPGGIAGYVGTISAYRSFVRVRAKTDVIVGFLPRPSVELLVERYPVILLTMAKRLTSLLPRLLLHIDFALEWVQIDAGQIVHQQNDDADAIYIVLNGRLRAITKKARDGMRVTGEYGQGESVGELEVMTESRRPATLHAIRDTEVAKFPKSLFNSLALQHPGITIKISKIIAQRMRALIEDPLSEQYNDLGHKAASTRSTTSSSNLRTIAVLPVTAGVPVTEFGANLLCALEQACIINGVVSLNQAAILNHLGRHAFSSMGKLKLAQYLADLEERYGMLLFIADTNVSSPWTKTCISQADCILLVALADASTSIGEYERFLLGIKTTARKELVLLHADRYFPAGLTQEWLHNRPWISGGHHHIQLSWRRNNSSEMPRTQNQLHRKFGTAIKQRVQVLQAEFQRYTSQRSPRKSPSYSLDTPQKGDFHRLARRLCGKAIGLVLGGGGARGLAHIGVIRAFEEAGVPIDIVGGTSIGSFIGALYARDANVVPLYGRAKQFAGRMGSIWRFALDLTYPSAAYTTGHEFNRGIFKAFGNGRIEDSWLQFYCNTTNITRSRMEFHDSGYIWRYVRASMTLAGLLPPICDNGSLLLDGGYIDNLPVGHMKSLGAAVIFAVDVGAADPLNDPSLTSKDVVPPGFTDSLSGFWAAFNRWNPFSPYPNPPTLSEIQARLAYVSSVDALERAKVMPGVCYIRPPIDHYGTLEFGKFNEIVQVGHEFGQKFLRDFLKQDSSFLKVISKWKKTDQMALGIDPRLYQQVSRREIDRSHNVLIQKHDKVETTSIQNGHSSDISTSISGQAPISTYRVAPEPKQRQTSGVLSYEKHEVFARRASL